jgi:hypothetical protein
VPNAKNLDQEIEIHNFALSSCSRVSYRTIIKPTDETKIYAILINMSIGYILGILFRDLEKSLDTGKI